MALRARTALVAVAFSVASGVAPASGDPALDYVLNCQGCHRADGGATEGAVPALSGSVARFLAVPGGREFLVQVPGVAQSVLDDERLAALLNWIVERFDAAHLPASFPRYTASEVGELRKRPLTNVERIRDGLVARLAAPLAPPISPVDSEDQ